MIAYKLCFDLVHEILDRGCAASQAFLGFLKNRRIFPSAGEGQGTREQWQRVLPAVAIQPDFDKPRLQVRAQGDEDEFNCDWATCGAHQFNEFFAIEERKGVGDKR